MHAHFAGINRKGKRKSLALVSVVVALAIFISFTMAWFTQELVSSDNILNSGSVSGSVELWVQVADQNGVFNEKLYDSDFDFSNTLAADQGFKPGALYLLDMDTSKLSEPDKANAEQAIGQNKLLADVMKPGQRVARRLIIRNSDPTLSLGFHAVFDRVDGDGLLAADDKVESDSANFGIFEALKLSTFNVTDSGASPVAATTNVDGLSLLNRSINGRVAPGSYAAYELWFDYAASASMGYADTSFSLGMSLTAFGSFNNTHYIETEDQLDALLDSSVEPSLKNGDTILLCNDLTVGSFIADKAFNLNLQGYTLTVDGPFAINIPKDDQNPDADAFMTMDIGMSETIPGKTGAFDDAGNGQTTAGRLIVNGGPVERTVNGQTNSEDNVKFSINAPGVALRWQTDSGMSLPDVGTPADGENPAIPSAELNVRSFNGVRGGQVENPGLGVVALPGGQPEQVYTSYNQIRPLPLGGTGSIDDPFTISSLGQWRTFESIVNQKHSVDITEADGSTVIETVDVPFPAGVDPVSFDTSFSGKYLSLTSDLDFNHILHVLPVGGRYIEGTAYEAMTFSGNFDGKNHKIINCDITVLPKEFYLGKGLFAWIKGAVIQNLGKVGGVVANSASSGSSSRGIGGIVGRCVAAEESNLINNCYNTGDVVSNGNAFGGGIVGAVAGYAGLVIMNCYNTGTIGTADAGYVNGGIVGGQNARIINCYNTGDVFASNGYAGGIKGDGGGEIINCYNLGNVSGGHDIGGIVGSSIRQGLEIRNCYNLGQVTIASESAFPKSYGSIVGSLCEATSVATITPLIISNCYALEKTADQTVGYNRPDELNHLVCTQTEEEMVKTYAEMTDPAFVNRLNAVEGADTAVLTSGFKAPRQYGALPFPWLAWQMESPDYTLTYEDRDQTYDFLADIQAAGYDGGRGTEWDPYIIGSFGAYKQLYEDVMADTSPTGDATVGKHYALTRNLDFDNITNVRPIGKYISDGDARYFAGCFDGGNHSIQNIKILTDGSAVNECGIFGIIQHSGAVLNLQAIDCQVNAVRSTDVGILIGTSYGLTQNCHVIRGTVSGEHVVGGVVGRSYGPVINCSNSAAVTANYLIGGIAGEIHSQNLQECINYGKVSGTLGDAGGIAGRLTRGASIQNCINMGDLTVSGDVARGIGGIAGQHGLAAENIESVSIENCYNLGTITFSGDEVVGSICGSVTNEAIHSLTALNCYALTGTAPKMIGYDAAILKDNFRTEEEMKSLEFVKALGDGFRFSPGDYPRLSWQE